MQFSACVDFLLPLCSVFIRTFVQPRFGTDVFSSCDYLNEEDHDDLRLEIDAPCHLDVILVQDLGFCRGITFI